MGFAVDWVAGGFEPGWSADGPATVVPGLEIGGDGPDPAALAAALDGADLVVVENLCTIPLNPAAAHAVAAALRGRPAVLHHHDPPWQRERFAHVVDLPPDDAAWRHVTVNDLTRRQMADRGLAATTIHNGFDPDPPLGDRAGTRARLGVELRGATLGMVPPAVRHTARHPQHREAEREQEGKLHALILATNLKRAIASAPMVKSGRLRP